jgi:hypothetical protein
MAPTGVAGPTWVPTAFLSITVFPLTGIGPPPDMVNPEANETFPGYEADLTEYGGETIGAPSAGDKTINMTGNFEPNLIFPSGLSGTLCNTYLILHDNDGDVPKFGGLGCATVALQ